MVSDHYDTLEETYTNLRQLAALLGHEDRAEALIQSCRERVNQPRIPNRGPAPHPGHRSVHLRRHRRATRPPFRISVIIPGPKTWPRPWAGWSGTPPRPMKHADLADRIRRRLGRRPRPSPGSLPRTPPYSLMKVVRENAPWCSSPGTWAAYPISGSTPMNAWPARSIRKPSNRPDAPPHPSLCPARRDPGAAGSDGRCSGSRRHAA